MPSISQKELDALLKAKEKIEERKAYQKAYYQNVIKPALKAFHEAQKSKEK